MGDHDPYDEDDEDDMPQKKQFNSYSVRAGGSYLPIAEAVNGLPNGFYKTPITYEGLTFSTHSVESDELMDIPGSVVEDIFKDMKSFWGMKEIYAQYKLIHKRGYLLHGPRGTGKSSSVVMLGKQVVEAGGVVIYPSNETEFVKAVEVLHTSEKGRPLMFIIEEITEFLDEKTSEILAILDGEGSPANSVFVATTNEIDDLDDNIKKRPGRFDRVLKVDFPTAEVRHAYALKILQRGNLGNPVKDAAMVTDLTNGMSLAHVKEIIVASLILGQNPKDVAERIR